MKTRTLWKVCCELLGGGWLGWWVLLSDFSAKFVIQAEEQQQMQGVLDVYSSTKTKNNANNYNKKKRNNNINNNNNKNLKWLGCYLIKIRLQSLTAFKAAPLAKPKMAARGFQNGW